MEKVLVTGANGFVGKAVCTDLTARGMRVVAAVRNESATIEIPTGPAREIVSVGNIDAGTDWTNALSGCSSVIHLAARAHVLNDTIADPSVAFRSTNVGGSLQLARSAARAGVRRFVFVSSIGVNGNVNARPFTESDAPAPAEAYAVSKLEAEQVLLEETKGNGMELVIVRPPLVYGPECPGNFLRLLKLLSSGIPLPFGAISNKRSFVSVWNLADVLATCVLSRQAAGELFLVSDMEDVTLPELLRGLAVGMEKDASLFSLSPSLLGLIAGVTGQRAMLEKLCGNLTVDASRVRTVLNWHPPVPLAEGLRRTGSWYAAR
jgi:nucleoside-diphosphate-sugar epimerase